MLINATVFIKNETGICDILLFSKPVFLIFVQWGSVNNQMAEPVPSISCCIFNNNDFFTKSQMS